MGGQCKKHILTVLREQVGAVGYAVWKNCCRKCCENKVVAQHC